jgi:hypothetical protein
MKGSVSYVQYRDVLIPSKLYCILYSSCHRHWIIPLVILVSSTCMYNLHSVVSTDIFYSRSRWRSFTNGNGMDSSSSSLYTGNRTYNLFIIFYRNYFIYFYFISVSTYQKYKCVETTECKLYMHVDDTKITSGIIQCLWHEEYRIQVKLLHLLLL